MIKILHIPKTGGTVIKRTIVPGDYRKHERGVPWLQTVIPGVVICDHFQHLNRSGQYIMFVRDPIAQFVSHFLFIKHRGEGYDTAQYFSKPREPKEMRRYDNINDFIAHIEEVDFTPKSIRRLTRSIHEITEGPENIKRCRPNIMFVVRTEYLEPDFEEMQKHIAVTNRDMGCHNLLKLKKDYINAAPGKVKEKGKLTEEMRAKLREFLQREYDCIDALKEVGLLPEDYLRR